MVGMATHKAVPSPPSPVCLVSSSPKRLSQMKLVTTSICLNKMFKLEGELNHWRGMWRGSIRGTSRDGLSELLFVVLGDAVG